MDNQLALLTLFGSILALAFAASRAARVLKFPQGNEQMQKISSSIHHGAMAYLRRQYRILICFFAGMFVILFAMAAFGYLTWFVPFAFITGGFFSGLSGFVGMQIATRANARTAAACQHGLNKGLNVAFSAGSVMGFTVVGLGLLDISIWSSSFPLRTLPAPCSPSEWALPVWLFSPVWEEGFIPRLPMWGRTW